MSPAASRYLGLVADSLFGEDPEAHALMTRHDGTVLTGGEATRNPALADVLEELAVDGAALFTDRPGRPGPGGRDAARRAGHRRRPGGVLPRGAPRAPVRRGRLDDRGQPASLGGRSHPRGDARRAGAPGAWTWADAIEVQHRVLRYRNAVHDRSADLEADGIDLLARVSAQGLGGLRGSSSTAHVSAVDADGNACAITMSSGYGAGLCIPGTGILLNNSPRRGRAQPARPACPAARDPPGVQHGAHDGPRRGRAHLGDRLPRRRPDHHRADAGAGPGLPARRRPARGDRRPAAAPAAGPRRRLRGRARA